MDNNFLTGFSKVAMINTMAKITRIVRRVKKVKPVNFPKVTHHPATVNLAKSFKGRERAMQKMQAKHGKKKFHEVMKMKESKDIAAYDARKAKDIAARDPNKYQGTTHDYAAYRKEFKEKAMAARNRKF